MEDIKNLGSKGRLIMWILILFILFIVMLVWIYKMNLDSLPS